MVSRDEASSGEARQSWRIKAVLGEVRFALVCYGSQGELREVEYTVR